MRRTSCFAFRETIENDGTFTYDCKALKLMNCDKCPFYKTHEQFGLRQVEADMQKYAERMGELEG